MAIDESFFIEGQGRTMVLYGGLLAEAHERGLKRIDTELLQVPHAGNENVAICKAVVTLEAEHGATGEIYDEVFSGIGDASPENVKDHRTKRLIAMAETRAKARALRDAVNVGVTALEELSDGEPQGDAPRPARANVTSLKGKGGDLPATAKQLGYVESLVNEAGDMRKFLNHIGKPLDELTRDEASDWIARLSGRGKGEADG